MSGFNSQSTPKAKRIHQCDECLRVIEVGETYIRNSGMWDGDFYSVAAHLDCYEASQKLQYDPSDEWVPLHDMRWEHEDVKAIYEKLVANKREFPKKMKVSK